MLCTSIPGLGSGQCVPAVVDQEDDWVLTVADHGCYILARHHQRWAVAYEQPLTAGDLQSWLVGKTMTGVCATHVGTYCVVLAGVDGSRDGVQKGRNLLSACRECTAGCALFALTGYSLLLGIEARVAGGRCAPAR